MRIRCLVVVIIACNGSLAACHTGGTSTRAVHAEPELRAWTSSSTPHPAPQATAAMQTSVPPSAAEPSWRAYYAFAPEIARAEIRRGDTRLIDFGEPSDAKYSLGGWLTLTAGETLSSSKANAVVVRSKSAKLFLPLDTDPSLNAPVRLTLRMRSFAATPLMVYSNGKKIGEQKLTGHGFETL